MSGGTNSTSSTQSMPSWAEPYAQSYLQNSANVASTPYQPFQGQQQAGLNQQQYGAFDAIQNRAMQGDPTISAGAGFLQSTLSGGQAQGATQNPYGQVKEQTNAYAGSNPYLQQSIDSALGDVNRNYNLTVAPQMDRLAAQSGSFGNSGVQQMTGEAGRQYTQQIGQMANSMRMQDYTQQQQLGESAANRNLQAQQFNAGMGQDWASRNDAMTNNSQARQLQAAQLAPTYGNAAYQDASQLLNVGDRLQAQNQGDLTNQYNQYLDARNYNQNQLGIMGRALGGNYGGTTTQQGPTGSTVGQGLGAGLSAFAATGNPYLAGGAALLPMLFGK